MAKPYKELRDKMSPEARKKSDEMAKEMLAELQKQEKDQGQTADQKHKQHGKDA